LTDDIDINEWIVSKGWAVACRKYSEDYVASENETPDLKHGIWGSRLIPMLVDKNPFDGTSASVDMPTADT